MVSFNSLNLVRISLLLPIFFFYRVGSEKVDDPLTLEEMFMQFYGTKRADSVFKTVICGHESKNTLSVCKQSFKNKLTLCQKAYNAFRNAKLSKFIEDEGNKVSQRDCQKKRVIFTHINYQPIEKNMFECPVVQLAVLHGRVPKKNYYIARGFKENSLFLLRDSRFHDHSGSSSSGSSQPSCGTDVELYGFVDSIDFP